MIDRAGRLWPYSTIAAMLILPVVWVFLGILIALMTTYANWPDAGSRTIVTYFVLAASVLPLGLALLDFASARRARLEWKGFTIDFTTVDVRPEFVGVPDNVGLPGIRVDVDTKMQISSALKNAPANEIVVVDIKDGSTWWVTRLLALSAGAARAGSPKALVFLGVYENVERNFLGWAEPKTVVAAILADEKEYRSRFDRATKITRQLVMFADPNVTPPGFQLPPQVARYTAEYADLGDAVFEQILMDQLAYTGFQPPPEGGSERSLEDPPDRLTLARLNTLLAHCLYRDAVDLAWCNEEQIARLLDSRAPYVALLRNGKYESMLRQDAGERLIIRQLVQQAQEGTSRSGKSGPPCASS